MLPLVLQSSNHATSSLSEQISKFMTCKCYHDFILKAPHICAKIKIYIYIYVYAQTIEVLMKRMTNF